MKNLLFSVQESVKIDKCIIRLFIEIGTGYI